MLQLAGHGTHQTHFISVDTHISRRPPMLSISVSTNRLAIAIFAVLGLASASLRMAQAADGFPLRDGDTWVMAGDSITAQHLHSNYFEAFCFARYPQLTFRFRNSGVGGDTIPKVLARFDWDVAAWKPTV